MNRDAQYYLNCERYEPNPSDKDGGMFKILTVPIEDYKKFDIFEIRCPYLYRIRDEDGSLMPFIFNEAQQVLHEAVEEEFARSKAEIGQPRCKIITLKPRQFGATTYTAIRNIDIMLRVEGAYGLVLNHTEVDIPLIYDKYQVAYDNLPDFIEVVDKKGRPIERIKFKPKTLNYSGFQMRFKDNQSWLNIRTAGAGDNVGKGSTLRFCHFTESANYVHYDKVMTSVKQQMSNLNAMAFTMNETTANGTTGVGEGYYKAWVRAENAWKKFISGEIKTFSGERPVFIKWYLLKKYRKDLVDGQLEDIEDIDFGTPEMKQQFLEREKILVEQMGVPIEAINWYRYNIKENCEYKYADAMRYYPTFPEDAFLSTTNTFFNSAKLYELKAAYEQRKRVDDFEIGYLNEDLEFVPSTFGELRIKKHPEEGCLNRYIVSLDQSEGLEGGDYASMKVFDRLEKEYVAHWFGKMAEDLLANEFMKLGYYYNQAYLIPERNRTTVINIIKPDGIIPYEGEIYAEYTSSGEPKWGWFTSGATRKLMLDENYAFLRDNGYDKIFSELCLDQYLSFVRNVTGRGTVRYEASAGKSDDIVISDCLCIVYNNRIEDEIGVPNDDRTDLEKFVESEIVRKRKSNKIKPQTVLGRAKSVLQVG